MSAATDLSPDLIITTNYVFIGIGALTIIVTVVPLLYSLYQRYYLHKTTPGIVALWVMFLLPWAPTFRVADLALVTNQLVTNPDFQSFIEILLGTEPFLFLSFFLSS